MKRCPMADTVVALSEADREALRIAVEQELQGAYRRMCARRGA